MKDFFLRLVKSKVLLGALVIFFGIPAWVGVVNTLDKYESHLEMKIDKQGNVLSNVKKKGNANRKFFINRKEETIKDGDLVRILSEQKVGYVNKKGEVIIKPTFYEAKDFFDGLAAVKISGKWGYIDKTGKIIIEPLFDCAYPFLEGLARVGIGGAERGINGSYIKKLGYIDKTGKMVIEPQFEIADGFSEGLAAVAIKDMSSGKWEGFYKYGYIDKSGKFIIKPQFINAYEFNDGLALIETKSEYGYIDKTGKFVIKPQYNYAYSFKNGVATVGKNLFISSILLPFKIFFPGLLMLGYFIFIRRKKNI